MKKPKIPIDLLISVFGSLISDKEPTTKAGKVFRWIKKATQIKDGANIRIKK
mgnify:CR=1 FL=1